MIVISPHLDDAVFGCSTVLAGTTVVTVCAGIPPEDTPPSQFDLRAGFQSAADAMRTRRAEDLAAAARLGFTPIHLDRLDASYATAPQPFESTLEMALSDDVVYGPLGLRHPDHRDIAAAFRAIVRRRKMQAWVYEELPYAYVWPDQLAPALTEAGCGERTVTRLSGPRKESAVRDYRSQVGDFTHMEAILAPERYHPLV